MFIPLPRPDFHCSLSVLGPDALQKATDDAGQCLLVLTTPRMANVPQANNPTARMWRGYQMALAEYVSMAWDTQNRRRLVRSTFITPPETIVAAINTGRTSDDVIPWINRLRGRLNGSDVPWWFGWPRLHESHRARLIRSSPLFYRNAFNDHPPIHERPMVWPGGADRVGEYRVQEHGKHGTWSEWRKTDYRFERSGITCRI